MSVTRRPRPTVDNLVAAMETIPTDAWLDDPDGWPDDEDDTW